MSFFARRDTGRADGLVGHRFRQAVDRPERQADACATGALTPNRSSRRSRNLVFLAS